MAVEEEKECVPSAAKLEETEDSESGLLDISFEATGTLAAVYTPAGRKYYKCPLCPRVLPSSRGFNIHVGRKHQVSNYQGNQLWGIMHKLYVRVILQSVTSFVKIQMAIHV